MKWPSLLALALLSSVFRSENSELESAEPLSQRRSPVLCRNDRSPLEERLLIRTVLWRPPKRHENSLEDLL